MQIDIAICDDEREICSQLENILIETLNKRLIKYEIDTFNAGEKLCTEMKKTKYDIIFLDIEMPNMNGVDIGKYIREQMKDEIVQIAYISAKESYAMELFEYRPINFLVKPLDDHKIEKVIDKYLVVSEQNNYMFTYKKGYEIYKIPMSEILYFENRSRKVTVVTKEGSDSFYDSMDHIYSYVKNQKFLFVHKSTIVNYNFVKKLGYEQVTMTDGRVFSISQSRRKAIRTMYMDIRKG